MNHKYVIVSPARNEAKYIEKTLKSVISQTTRPISWIIVNDGSTDETRSIVAKYSAEYSWIIIVDRPPSNYGPGRGVVEAFYAGYAKVKDSDFDFIVKLDADLEFNDRYFEDLFKRFDENPKMGMASGKTYVQENGKLIVEECPDFIVRGPSKVYRKECFNDIGKLYPARGWDTIDIFMAKMKGWETRSYADLVVIHLRRMGWGYSGISKGRLNEGKTCYFLGYHPIFMLAKCVYKLFDKPYILGSCALLVGYLSGYLKNAERFPDKAFIEYLRRHQIRRMFGKKD